MSIRRYRNGSQQACGNARRPFRLVRRIQKTYSSAVIHYSLLPIPYLRPWRFSSEYAEDDTATVYYNYRHYEPVMGRWLGRDPEGEAASHNLSAFLANDGVSRVDYLGLMELPLILPPIADIFKPPVSSDSEAKCKPCEIELSYVSQKTDDDRDEFERNCATVLKSSGAHRVKHWRDFKPNEKLPSKDCCVKKLIIAGHGKEYVTSDKTEISDSRGKVVGYKDDVYMVLGRSSLWEGPAGENGSGSTAISDLINRAKIKFCGKCVLELRSCFLGRSPVLKANLERVTNCEVILHNDLVNPYGTTPASRAR